ADSIAITFRYMVASNGDRAGGRYPAAFKEGLGDGLSLHSQTFRLDLAALIAVGLRHLFMRLLQRLTECVVELVPVAQCSDFLCLGSGTVQRDDEAAVGVAPRAAALGVHFRRREYFVEGLQVCDPNSDLGDLAHRAPHCMWCWQYGPTLLAAQRPKEAGEMAAFARTTTAMSRSQGSV